MLLCCFKLYQITRIKSNAMMCEITPMKFPSFIFSRFTYAFTDIHGPKRACTDTQRHSRTLVDTHRHSQALTGVHRHSRKRLISYSHSQILTDPQRHSQRLNKHSRVVRNIYGHYAKRISKTLVSDACKAAM